jgi:hypothetical protein
MRIRETPPLASINVTAPASATQTPEVSYAHMKCAELQDAVRAGQIRNPGRSVMTKDGHCVFDPNP